MGTRRPGHGAAWWAIVLLVPLVVVGGLVAGLVASRPVGPPAGASAGDPYFPHAGATGWDALSYTIQVGFDETLREVRGSTTITGLATAHLDAIHLDLAHPIEEARVNGAAAPASRLGGVNKVVRPPSAIAPGTRFTVEVSWAGDPSRAVGLTRTPVHRGPGEVLIAGEPEASAVWFAANDHPSDAARMEVFATVPAGREALSVGRLVSRDADDDPATATWHWRSGEEMATYLTFLAVGEFSVEEADDGGRPAVYAVSDALLGEDAAEAWRTLRRTPEVVAQMEELYGPYPFSTLGGVVVGVRPWWAGLETQGRPVYDDALGSPFGPHLLAHEVAHQWFGNHVRVATWDDIVNNEGWATFAAHDWEARHAGGQHMDAWLRATWEGTDQYYWQATIADPGLENMFGTTYDRGGLALQALRRVLGDEEFYAVARAWAQQPGARSFEDFTAFVEARTGRDLAAFWDAWYRAPVEPPRTPAFGWPG